MSWHGNRWGEKPSSSRGRIWWLSYNYSCKLTVNSSYRNYKLDIERSIKKLYCLYIHVFRLAEIKLYIAYILKIKEIILVLVSLFKQALRSSSSTSCSNVLAKASLRVGLAPSQEHLLCFPDILFLPTPCLEGALLQRSTEWERQCPWLQHFQLVHRIQVHCCLFLTLPTWQEHNSRDCRWDCSPQCCHSVLCNHLCSNLTEWNRI